MKYFYVFIIMFYSLFGLTGIELAEKMENRDKPIDSKTDLIMTLTNKKGNSRSYILHSIFKEDGKKQLIWILEPLDDKGIAFLKIEQNKNNDEMKMWLPAFKKIRRISGNNRSDSFMGSDLSYEDMATRSLNQYNFTIISKEIYKDLACYKLESIPKKNVNTEYFRHISLIDSTLLVPLKEESYDKSNKLIKEKLFTYKLINGYQILIEVEVNNVQKNHRTNLVFNNIELNTKISDKIFHERYLKRMPK